MYENGVQHIEQLINELRRVSEQSTCHRMFKNVSTVNVPRTNCFLDTSISDFPLCTGIRTTNTTMCDKIIVVQLMFSPYENLSELYQNKPAVEVLHKVALKEIPTDIKAENKFYLRGVVGFSHYGGAHNLGHYVAYVLRNDGKWEAYDDMHDKVDLDAVTYKIVPHIIMHSV